MTVRSSSSPGPSRTWAACSVTPFGWFIGCALAAVVYYPLARRRIRVPEAVPRQAAQAAA
jgi:cytosine/uracil/thiamine/allantoin permease